MSEVEINIGAMFVNVCPGCNEVRGDLWSIQNAEGLTVLCGDCIASMFNAEHFDITIPKTGQPTARLTIRPRLPAYDSDEQEEDSNGTCHVCNGSGEGMHDGSRCWACSGAGEAGGWRRYRRRRWRRDE